MLSSEQIAAIADELAEADRAHSVIPRITARYPDATVEDSYAIQGVWRDKNVASGRRLVGRKIGLTSKAMQQATGISEPDYGVMFDDTVFQSGADIPVDRFSNVRIEVELAFVLRRAARGTRLHALEDALGAIDYAVPALEVLNSHIELEGRTIVDTISDNAAYGAMVLGCDPQASRRDRPAVGAGAAVPQRRDRGDRRRGRRPGSSGDGCRMARQQVLPARRPPRGRRDHPRRVVHPPDVGGTRRQRPVRLRTDGRDHVPLQLNPHLPRPLAAASPPLRRHVGVLGLARWSPRSARAPAWTGC